MEASEIQQKYVFIRRVEVGIIDALSTSTNLAAVTPSINISRVASKVVATYFMALKRSPWRNVSIEITSKKLNDLSGLRKRYPRFRTPSALQAIAMSENERGYLIVVHSIGIVHGQQIYILQKIL